MTRGNGAVYAFTPTRGEYRHEFGASKWQVEQYDLRHQQRFLKPGGGWVVEYCSAEALAEGRNAHFRTFINGEAEWLLMVDDDMAFSPFDLEQLIESSDPDSAPIVGALCFKIKSAGHADGMTGRYRIEPTIARHVDTDEFWGFVPDYLYQPDALVKCAGTGAAFLLVHRSAAEKIAATAPAPFTRLPIPKTGKLLGEDLSFCVMAAACDLPIHVNTGVRISHLKTWSVDESEYLRQLRAGATGHQPVTVVIPVLNRSELTRQILEDLVAQFPERVFIYDNGSADDTTEVVTEAAKAFPDGVVELIDANGWGFHRMWNDGVDRSLAYNPTSAIAFLNNDLRVAPGALSEMRQTLMGDERVAAVSANYDKRSWFAPFQRVNGICAGRYDGTGGLAGFAFMVKGHLFASGGVPRFDEQFALWYGDTDFVRELEVRGWWYGIAVKAQVEHVNGGSQSSSQRKDLDKLITEDRILYEAKWGAA